MTEKEGRFYPSVKNSMQPGCMASSGAKRNDQPPLPVRFTKLEKAWLKALLEEPEMRMVLGIKTLEKLKKELEGFDSPIKCNISN